MTSLSLREQRLVALFILMLLLFLLSQLLLAPVVDGFAERKEERARLVAAYQRNDALVASMPLMRRRLEAQRADRSRFALAAPSPAAASDRLRERLGDRFAAAGGVLRGMEESAARAGWIGASINGDLTLDQLSTLLADLQNQPPYLVVTNLTIVADRAFQSGKLDVMNVKIDVAIPYTRAA